MAVPYELSDRVSDVVFSQSIFVHTTEDVEFLEPSLWIKVKFAVGAVLLYGVSIAGLIVWCYMKGFIR